MHEINHSQEKELDEEDVDAADDVSDLSRPLSTTTVRLAPQSLGKSSRARERV